MRHGAGARQRLDAAHAGRDAGFLGDDERADVAGGAHVRAAAQLDAEAGDRTPRGRVSPYFSPKSAIAPALIASSVRRVPRSSPACSGTPAR